MKQNLFNNLPLHVAIIMDGNGRWASIRGLPRVKGHEAGIDAAKKIINKAGEMGIKYLTLFAFSIENWGRPQDEVMYLFSLFDKAINTYSDELIANGVKVKFMGTLSLLPPDIQEGVSLLESQTADNNHLTLVIAMSYGSRQEIVDATKAISQKILNDQMTIDDINVDSFRQYLYLPELPDPDLIIRTSGEKRFSNFLLFQSAYSELYFTDTLWPDFDESEFEEAIADFSNRKRRYGKI
ncbi:MAG: isoprenyl transferase [Bacteroidales bacterium]|jgi:undecaprenyl diphosphate synthase|nr:isoprenyl transferase [Bacteroidales bacterium]MDI9576089.1 isoprenyl transferase [Bacteroidota bacterium]MDY0401526.1 isoprenyl transferase [Bacteroidales bacterium]